MSVDRYDVLQTFTGCELDAVAWLLENLGVETQCPTIKVEDKYGVTTDRPLISGYIFLHTSIHVENVDLRKCQYIFNRIYSFMGVTREEMTEIERLIETGYYDGIDAPKSPLTPEFEIDQAVLVHYRNIVCYGTIIELQRNKRIKISLHNKTIVVPSHTVLPAQLTYASVK